MKGKGLTRTLDESLSGKEWSKKVVETQEKYRTEEDDARGGNSWREE